MNSTIFDLFGLHELLMLHKKILCILHLCKQVISTLGKLKYLLSEILPMLYLFIGCHNVSRDESKYRFFKENSTSSITLVRPSRIQSPNSNS